VAVYECGIVVEYVTRARARRLLRAQDADPRSPIGDGAISCVDTRTGEAVRA
jgi:hypothetical protein